MGKSKYLVIGTGVAVGLAALILTAAGNPANMGCTARKRCSTCARRSPGWCSAQ